MIEGKKKKQRDPLELQNMSLSSLELGYIYVFNLDKKTIFIKKASEVRVIFIRE